MTSGESIRIPRACGRRSRMAASRWPTPPATSQTTPRRGHGYAATMPAGRTRSFASSRLRTWHRCPDDPRSSPTSTYRRRGNTPTARHPHAAGCRSARTPPRSPDVREMRPRRRSSWDGCDTEVRRFLSGSPGRRRPAAAAVTRQRHCRPSL
jgi:hypothetical protein